MVKLDLEKAEETEIKLTTFTGSSKKGHNSRKASTSASLTMLEPLTVWITTNCGKFLKRWEYQATLPAFWETWVQVKKQQLEPDIEYIKALYCHPAYLAYTQYILGNAGVKEVPAGIKIAMRNISNLRYADDITLMAESEEELKSPLMKGKEESEKVGLKLNTQKTNIMASSPITSWQIDGKTMEIVTDFLFLGFKITADSDCSNEIKRCLPLGTKAMTT